MPMKLSKTREQLAEMFLSSLEEEALPWHQPWVNSAPRFGQAHNFVTDTHYHGVNAVILWAVSMNQGYVDPRWCTFKQATENGWRVKKGEHGVPIEFWSIYDTVEKKNVSRQDYASIIQDEPDREQDFRINCKCYTVFNASQIEGVPQLQGKDHVPPVYKSKILDEFALTYLRASGITLKQKDYAAYSPTTDTLYMPPKEAFFGELEYYDTLFHECAHSTGHPSRLNRELGTSDQEKYAIEELRAEIAGAFILSSAGCEISQSISENNKAYVQIWASRIKDDRAILFQAVKDADSICDYVEEKGELTRILSEYSVGKKMPGVQPTAESLQNSKAELVLDDFVKPDDDRPRHRISMDEVAAGFYSLDGPEQDGDDLEL